MPLYAYCTLSNDQNYTVKDGKVFIAGQANVMTKHMYTPVFPVCTGMNRMG